MFSVLFDVCNAYTQIVNIYAVLYNKIIDCIMGQ